MLWLCRGSSLSSYISVVWDERVGWECVCESYNVGDAGMLSPLSVELAKFSSVSFMGRKGNSRPNTGHVFKLITTAEAERKERQRDRERGNCHSLSFY